MSLTFFELDKADDCWRVVTEEHSEVLWAEAVDECEMIDWQPYGNAATLDGRCVAFPGRFAGKCHVDDPSWLTDCSALPDCCGRNAKREKHCPLPP